MEDGLEHLAGTGSRVSLGRVQERPFRFPEVDKQGPNTDMGMREYYERRKERARKQQGGASCKAMSPQCMGQEAYDEYISGRIRKPRQEFNKPPPPPRITLK